MLLSHPICIRAPEERRDTLLEKRTLTLLVGRSDNRDYEVFVFWGPGWPRFSFSCSRPPSSNTDDEVEERGGGSRPGPHTPARTRQLMLEIHAASRNVAKRAPSGRVVACTYQYSEASHRTVLPMMCYIHLSKNDGKAGFSCRCTDGWETNVRLSVVLRSPP